MATKTRTDRIVTNEDIIRYEPMIESWMRKSVKKNWIEASVSKYEGEIILGNSGYTMNDIRQHLRTEVVIALKNYNPDRNTKESTFVYGHLFNRVGQLMKRLTKKSKGYGIWVNNLEVVLNEIDEE
jgi:hypothetical protein